MGDLDAISLNPLREEEKPLTAQPQISSQTGVKLAWKLLPGSRSQPIFVSLACDTLALITEHCSDRREGFGDIRSQKRCQRATSSGLFQQLSRAAVGVLIFPG